MDGTPAPEPYTTFVNGVKYLIKNNVAIVKGVEDDSIVEIAIPAEVDGFPVTTIGSRAFEDCENLANVTLPEGLLVIGEGAFYGCTALTHIDLPEGLLYIEGYDGGAFSGCTALESIALPEGLLSIGSGTFYGCESLVTVTCPSTLLMIGYEAFEDCYALESVILNEGLKEIGYDAFAYCESLKSITIPASVWYLGGDDDCFNGCTSLESINVAEGNEYYAFRDGVLYNADFTELLTYPNRKKEETFTLPATVTSVNPLSNDNPNLKTILVEDGNKYFESRDGVLYRNYVYMEGGNVVSEFTALVWYP